jgi:hypothetical protein
VEQAAPAPSPSSPAGNEAGAADIVEASPGKTSTVENDEGPAPGRPDGEAIPPASPSEAAPEAKVEEKQPDPPKETAKPKAAKAPKFDPPKVPTDGSDYPRYVREQLATPGNDIEADVRAWWASPFEKKLRNSLPNYTDELAKESIGVVSEHIAKLKQGEAT